MDQIKTVQGVLNVYDSKEAKGFKDSAHYPIAWETIFVNDPVGKEFAEMVFRSFEELPKERGYIMEIQGGHSDVARCLECVFHDKDSFRQVVNKAFKNISFFDEREKSIIPRQKMIDEAGKISKQSAALAF